MSDSAPAPAQAESPGARREPVIVQRSSAARAWWLLRGTLVAAYEDNCFGIAKGAAYSSLLSLFPILTTMTSLLVQARAQSVVHVLAAVVRQIAPPGTEDLILSRLRERGARPISLPVVAIMLSLWAGSGAMMSLMEGFDAAYRIPSGRHFLKERAMAIFLVLVAAVPAVGASSLIIFGNRGEVALIRSLGISKPTDEISTNLGLAWHISRYALAFATITLVTGLLYYFGPNYRSELDSPRGLMQSRFFRVWPGAFLTTCLWLVFTAGFAWYVSNIANYNFFYGSIGAVIVLLVWLYLVACIALIGCEFNAERERMQSLVSLR